MWFFCVLLPLLAFAGLADEVREKEIFFFDAPLLLGLHRLATPIFDQLFMAISKIGYQWGVIPLDILILLWFSYRKQFREGLFVGMAVVGSALLNVAAKHFFMRLRPALWLSITPETTYSFPSGHAMGSATLAMVVILLCWRTRWRWTALIVSVLFVPLVGVSRIYLGVHYPSDILAGWIAAIAWVVGVHELVIRKSPLAPGAVHE